MKNKLKLLRKSRGLSMEEVAIKLGTSHQQISRLEKSQRRMSDVWIKRYCDAFHMRPEDILEINSKNDLIPLVGYIGGATTFGGMDSEPIKLIDPISIGLRNFDEGMRLWEIENNKYIGTGNKGDWLWVDKNEKKQGEEIANLYNNRAFIVFKDGKVDFRIIKPSPKKGAYNLHSVNSPEIIEDAQIDCAYKVHAVIYR